MGEVDSFNLSQYPARATRVAVALALGRRFFVGPDVLEPPVDHPEHRFWLKQNLGLEMDTEWADPVRRVSVYALPQELRPGKLKPIVRRATWFLQKTKRTADKEGFFDADTFMIEYYSAGARFAAELDEKMRAFTSALDGFHTYDSMSPRVLDDSPARAVEWAAIQWGTRLEVADLRWSTEDYPARTELFVAAWNAIGAQCSEEHLVTDWSTHYRVPIELAFADPYA